MLRSLKKVFLLLDAFTVDQQEWSLADLSRKLKIAKPTVHHIIATLVEGGWIEKDTETKRFRLGLRLWEKGRLVIRQLGVRDVARPWVEALAEQCGETVRLGIFDSIDPQWLLYIDRVESQHAVRAHMDDLTRSPTYCVATGKSLLAHNPEIAKRVVALPLRGYTPHTLTQPAALLKDLAQTRDRGYSVNQGEFREDVVGVAAPIFNHEGRAVAAIGISGPAYRLGARLVRRMGPVVVAAAQEISKCMGHVQQGGSNGTATTRSRRIPLGRHVGRNRPGLSGAADRSVRGLRSRGR